MWISLRNSLSPFYFIISCIVTENFQFWFRQNVWSEADQKQKAGMPKLKKLLSHAHRVAVPFLFPKWDHVAKSHWDLSIHSSPRQKTAMPKISINTTFTLHYSVFFLHSHIFGAITNITQHGKSFVHYQRERKTNWNKKSFVFFLYSTFVSPGYFQSVFNYKLLITSTKWLFSLKTSYWKLEAETNIINN